MFDRERLEWLNGQWIRRLDADELVERLLPFLAGRAATAGRDRPDAVADEELRPLVPMVQERLPTLGAIGDAGRLPVRRRGRPSTRRCSCPSAGTRHDASRRSRRRATIIAEVGAVSFEADELEPPLRALAEERGWKAGDLFMAIRVAVTGRTATPPLFDTLVALGYERTLERLDRAIDTLDAAPPSSRSLSRRSRRQGFVSRNRFGAPAFSSRAATTTTRPFSRSMAIAASRDANASIVSPLHLPDTGV